MDDVTTLSISSVIASTTEDLERLHQAARERRMGSLRDLSAIVAGLGVGTPPDAEPQPPERSERLAPRDRVMAAPEPAPFVPLPRRTTHGGPFGPAVREKLIREALGG